MVKMASIPLQLAASRMLLAKNAELSPTVELARAYIEAFCRILDHVLQVSVLTLLGLAISKSNAIA
jgi:hypothetical protein